MFTEILQLVIARLRGSPTLTSQVPAVAIANHRPQVDPDKVNAVVLPWIRVIYTVGNDWSAKDQQGFDGEIVIDCWTDYHGDYKALLMAEIVNNLLHNQQFSSVTIQNLILQHSQTITLPEPDSTHHVVSRYRVVTVEN